MTHVPETSHEDETGRCRAVLEEGTRCPNAAEPGARYCALPEHQALADVESDLVVAPLAGDEPGGVAVDEGAEEAEAATEAAAIGGVTTEAPLGEDGTPDAAEQPVVEAGGEDAAGQEQGEAALRSAAEDAVEPDLAPDGQGFEEPDRHA